jgi:GH15 family glucan-1,4-alpha-glucosidase
MLVRSALVLKLLTHHATGALAAAATCSLPEQIGGERNWDYRYAWVRDSSFTIQALYNLGRAEEGHAFFTWLRRTCQRHGDPADMRLMYGLKGNPVPPERLLEHLEGYRGSNPVRVGNAAAHQQQHDIYGECVNAYHSLVSDGSHIAADEWQFVSALVDHACRIWREPDSGIWEVRTAPRHFVHSKLMCWVAADRGARMAAQRGDKAAAGRWQQEADAIKAAILSDGFSQRRNSFRQCFGADDLDASTLLIPVLGLVAGDSPQMLGTLDAVGRELRHGPFLLRYVSDDGVRGGEGCFILCSFWLVQALAAAGRVDEAEELLDQVVGFASPLGLLSEEIAPHSHELLGNFPQAFSHVGIISSIIAIGRAKGKPVSGEQDVQVSRQPRQTKAH